jgi:hypothetical protein
MRELFEFAEFLTSAWRLANPHDRMPTSHGILDQALWELRDQLPCKFQNTLTFGNTRVGFRCYELPEILYCAQANRLSSEPNSNYLTTEIQIQDETARRFLRRHGVDASDAREFGDALKKAADRSKAASPDFDVEAV